MRIKVEQHEALEEQKRLAREARLAAKHHDNEDGEGDEEPEEDEPEEGTQTHNDGNESFDQAGGSHEMQQIADFHCFDIPQFTMKVMQGVANRSLLSMNKHRRKTPE